MRAGHGRCDARMASGTPYCVAAGMAYGIAAGTVAAMSGFAISAAKETGNRPFTLVDLCGAISLLVSGFINFVRNTVPGQIRIATCMAHA